MADAFIGLPVSVQLSNGSLVEGTVDRLNPAQGALDLSHAMIRRFDGTAEPVKGGRMTVARDQVKDLTLLNVARGDPSAASSSSSTTSPGPRTLNRQPPSTSAVVDQLGPLTKSARRKHRKARSAQLSAAAVAAVERGAAAQYDAASEQVGVADFSRDFDFALGLQAFDKAKLWAEMASSSVPPPPPQNVRTPDRYTPVDNNNDKMKSLAPNEPVLSPPRSIPPPPGHVTTELRTKQGRLVIPQSWLTVQRVFARAAKGSGPNSAQRIEHGARAIAQHCGEIVPVTASRRHRGRVRCVVVLAQEGIKGCSSVRAGAMLAMRNWQVVVLVCGQLTNAFEAQLRTLLAAGGNVVSSSTSLPTTPDLVIDALHENVAGTTVDYTASCQSGLHWLHDMVQSPPPLPPVRPNSQIVHQHQRQQSSTSTCPIAILSIDIASFIDFDTGNPLYDHEGLKLDPPPTTHLICMATVPTGCLNWIGCPSAILLVDVSLPDRAWRKVTAQQQPTTTTTVTNGDVQQDGLAPWAEDWRTWVDISRPFLS